MKELDELLTSLHQKLNDDLTIASDNMLIAKMLRKHTLHDALLFRLRLVQIVGVIKFLLNIPIENFDVENKLFVRIEAQSNIRQLKPALTRLFFQTVIEQSKQLQYELFAKLENRSKVDCLLYLKDLVELLKKDKPQYVSQLALLVKSQVQGSEQLQVCRELIQEATDHALQTMGELFNLTKLEKQLGFFNFDQHDDAKNLSQDKHFFHGVLVFYKYIHQYVYN